MKNNFQRNSIVWDIYSPVWNDHRVRGVHFSCVQELGQLLLQTLPAEGKEEEGAAGPDGRRACPKLCLSPLQTKWPAVRPLYLCFFPLSTFLLSLLPSSIHPILLFAHFCSISVQFIFNQLFILTCVCPVSVSEVCRQTSHNPDLPGCKCHACAIYISSMSSLRIHSW